ncbi:hypothetical protein J2741_000892 [Methanolinea mesophila]|nr:hypothetical protein [Methanolinea mesophila]
MFNGTIDDFVPKQIVNVQETFNYGTLVEFSGHTIQVPGFNIYGAIILNLTGMSSENLIFFPFQLFPYTVIFFTIIYLISDNGIIAGSITLITMISGSTGTTTIFFWPHGIGYILFFTFLILIYVLFKNKNFKPVVLIATITGSALVYISYNLMAVSLILIATIVVFLFIYITTNKKIYFQNKNSLKIFTILFLVLAIVELGLSKFVYGVFIPTIQSAQELDLSGLDKFLQAYFNSNISSSPINVLLLQFPSIISIISGIKYSIIVLSIALFISYFIFNRIRKTELTFQHLFLLAFIATFLIYMIPRYYIGGVVITLLWLPGIFCIAHFYRFSNTFKLFATISIVIIAGCVITYYYTMDEYNYINHNDYNTKLYKIPAKWLITYSNENPTVSDELTKNFLIFYTYKEFGYSKDSLYEITQKNGLILSKDALSLTQLSNNPTENSYFVLNDKLPQLSLQNWIVIKPWKNYELQIDSNQKINKIYSIPLLSIYYS